jgi:hypothetical protein
LYWCEIYSFALREEHRLRVFQNYVAAEDGIWAINKGEWGEGEKCVQGFNGET